MGSCQCSNSAEPALNLPEEEVALGQLEQKHPFSIVPFDTILSHLSADKISKTDFLSICSTLDINSSVFNDGPYFNFMESLLDSSDAMNVHSLKLSAVILGQGTLDSKMHALFKMYKSNEEKIAIGDMRLMIQDLCHVSGFILPQMLDISDVESYVTTLQNSIPYLINKVTSLFDSSIGFSEFQELARGNAILQKLFCANGIRMILLEESVNSKENNTTKSFYCKTPRILKPPRAAISDDDIPDEDITREDTVILINVDIGNSEQGQIILKAKDDFEKATRKFALQHRLTFQQTNQLLKNIRKLGL